MPITQSRMIALLHAAQDYQSAFIRARHVIENECRAAREGKSPIDCLNEISYAVQERGLLMFETETKIAISLESAHWKLSRQRHNTKVAEHQRMRRAPTTFIRREQTQGQVPRHPQFATPTTAPTSLDLASRPVDNDRSIQAMLESTLRSDAADDGLAGITEAFGTSPVYDRPPGITDEAWHQLQRDLANAKRVDTSAPLPGWVPPARDRGDGEGGE